MNEYTIEFLNVNWETSEFTFRLNPTDTSLLQRVVRIVLTKDEILSKSSMSSEEFITSLREKVVLADSGAQFHWATQKDILPAVDTVGISNCKGMVLANEVTTVEQDTLKNPPKELAVEKMKKAQELKQWAAQQTAVFTDEYTQAEIASWDLQESEAKAYQSDPQASVPFIEGMATQRGITVDDLANRIITNSAAYKTLGSEVFGKRQKYFDQIEAATTLAEVEAVKFL